MIGDLMARLERVENQLSHLSHLYSQSIMAGPVAERDHEKGIRLNLGTEAEPFLSPWIQPGDRTGASRYLPEKGEQVMMLAPGGDHRQATMVPFTHSGSKKNPAKDGDETVHHARDGQRHSVKKGHVQDHADNKVTRSGGDPATRDGTGGSGGGANLPHELNRQLQGLRAQVTQNSHDIGGLFHVTSRLREIAQFRIPELAQLQDILNKQPGGLEKAAQEIAGQVESFLAKNFQQAVAKLANGLLGNIMGLVQGFMGGQIGDVLGQIETLAGQSGLGGAIAGPMAEARAKVGNAASGSASALQGPLDAMGAVFAGTPAAGAFAALRGQMDGALGAAVGMALNLGGLVDGQQNLTKGMTKSYRLGGYQGEE